MMKLKCQIKPKIQMTKPGGFGIPVLCICNPFVIWILTFGNLGNEIAAYLSGAGNDG
jgi:hypothetical protein